MNKHIIQAKREIWESPGIFYLAPVVLLFLLVLFSSMSFYSLSHDHIANWSIGAGEDAWSWQSDKNTDAQAQEDARPHSVKALEKISHGQYVIYILFGVVCLFNMSIYALAALVADRKDRSVLFFKSMPVSEWQVVLTKLVMACVLLPVIYWLAAVVTILAYTFLGGVFASSTFQVDSAIVWQNLRFMEVFSASLVGIILTALWTLPMIAVLLLVSSYSKKSPFGLLAALLLVLWLAEKWVLGSNYLGWTIRQYFAGLEVGGQISFVPVEQGLMFEELIAFWVRPGLYIGLVVTAVCVSSAVWLRNRRFEI